ncbi:MAG: hypothetical protein PHX74_06850 [Candidatus Sumerlaeales bacterium]|nr:hypothetical protein [Candidatus Sumerlaeales bacterium]
MNEFVSWGLIGTFAGLVAVTGILTEFAKNVAVINKIPTQIVSFVVSLVLVLLYKVSNGTFVLLDLALDIVNAIIASFAANGGYDLIARIFGTKIQDEQ